jgi:hypothetical protein
LVDFHPSRFFASKASLRAECLGTWRYSVTDGGNLYNFFDEINFLAKLFVDRNGNVVSLHREIGRGADGDNASFAPRKRGVYSEEIKKN